MFRKNIYKKVFIVWLVFFLVSISITPAFGKENIKFEEINSLIGQEFLLPPPKNMTMSFEKSILRRASVRNFTDEPVTDEELGTILWAAFGLRDDGKMTVPEINGAFATVIYVLMEDVYKYNPKNHSLVLFKEGDYRYIGQYEAPIQLGLCWNTDIADINLSNIELGAVGQNIYFAANVINLGTVITAEIPPAINPVGLPENEHGMGIMPIGHLAEDYNFKFRPVLFSFLPRIKLSKTSLTNALNKRNEVTSWESNTISRKDLSHLIWSSYGYSYYLDKSSNRVKRHHTVPSAHGYYPFRIYAVNRLGIFRYIYGLLDVDLYGLPVVSYLLPVSIGDKRADIAQATESFVYDAPLIIIMVLDIAKTNKGDDLSAPDLRWIWYYEAGAAGHNVLLQATARNMFGNILKIDNKEAICSVLKLDSEKFDPMVIIPVG
jgi:hypothetical protein